MPVVQEATANVKANGFTTWGEVVKWAPVAILVSLIVTSVQLLQTYSGFLGTVFTEFATYLLYMLNIIFSLITIILVRTFVRPTTTTLRHISYAAFVALAFQSLVHIGLPLGNELLGARESSAPSVDFKGSETFNIGTAVYDPIAKAISHSLDDPVRDLKRREMAELVVLYDGDEGVTRLVRDAEELFEEFKGDSGDEREKFLTKLLAVAKSQDVDAKTKVRRIARLIYGTTDLGRGAVQDLLKRESQ